MQIKKLPQQTNMLTTIPMLLAIMVGGAVATHKTAGACTQDSDCNLDACRTWFPRHCVTAASDDLTCYKISAAKPRWDGTNCVAEGTDDSTCAALSSMLPKFSTVPRRAWSAGILLTSSCKAAGTSDAKCAAVSAAKPRWDGTSACVADGTDDSTCAAINGGSLPKFSSVTSTCVVAGKDDATCAAISAAKPRWGGGACMADGTDDASCQGAPLGIPLARFSAAFGKCAACNSQAVESNGCPSAKPVCSDNKNLYTTSTCVAAATDDDSCWAIDMTKPRWDGTSACVADGTDDTSCAAINSGSLPVIGRVKERKGNPSGQYSAQYYCSKAPTNTAECRASYNPDCAGQVNGIYADCSGAPVAPIWDATTSACVVVTSDNDCANVNEGSLPKFSVNTHTCVAAGSNDDTCKAISYASPFFVLSSCTTCTAKTDANTPELRLGPQLQTFPDSCVPAGTSDASCEEIFSSYKPRFSTVSNTCVVPGIDDATCAAIDAAKPKWSGNACLEVSSKKGCDEAKAGLAESTYIFLYGQLRKIGTHPDSQQPSSIGYRGNPGYDHPICQVGPNYRLYHGDCSAECVECLQTSDCSSTKLCSPTKTCVAGSDETCAAINAGLPKWGAANSCVVVGSSDSTCAAINAALPKWGAANACVVVGSSDATCAAINADLPKWGAANACVVVGSSDATCTAITATLPKWGAANACVAVGSSDATCAAINAATPKWSTSSTTCVAAGTNDATCAVVSALKPRWDGTDTCVADGTNDSSCQAINGGSLPTFSSDTSKCVAAPAASPAAAPSPSSSDFDGANLSGDLNAATTSKISFVALGAAVIVAFFCIF